MTKSSILVFLILICQMISYHCVAQDKRPNIIVILTDDQRWDALGYTGNEIIKTPEMDQLASEGVYFNNAFVTTPICAASRVSIMTGLYERKHGYTFQQPPLSKSLIDSTYFALLKNSGYHTGFLGKMGVNFEDRLDTSLFDYYKPEYQSHYYKVIDGVHRHVTDCIGDNAVGFIKHAARETPFCLSISFHAPHAIDSSPLQYLWSPDVDEIENEVMIPGPDMDGDEHFESLPKDVKEGFNRVRWKWRYDTPEKFQQMVKGYYNMINGVDLNLGKIRKALEESGLADNTIIILLGDNGYFLGERQLAGKWLMYEPSLRIPLIVYDPHATLNDDVEDMVLNIDIAPTILDYARTKTVKTHGLSLRSYTNGASKHLAKRENFLCEHLWDFKHIPPSEGIRSDQYKYFRYINSPEIEELYNIEVDPDELNNLVNDPKYQAKIIELRKKCDELIDKVSK